MGKIENAFIIPRILLYDISSDIGGYMSKKLICPHCGGKKIKQSKEFCTCEICNSTFGRVAISDDGTPMVDAVKGLRFRYGDVVSGSVRLRIVQEEDGSCLFEVYDANEGGVDKVADVMSSEEWMAIKKKLFEDMYLADWDKVYIPNNDGQKLLDNNEWQLGVDVDEDEVNNYYGFDEYPVYWKDLMKLIEPFFNKLNR